MCTKQLQCIAFGFSTYVQKLFGFHIGTTYRKIMGIESTHIGPLHMIYFLMLHLLGY